MEFTVKMTAQMENLELQLQDEKSQHQHSLHQLRTLQQRIEELEARASDKEIEGHGEGTRQDHKGAHTYIPSDH